MKLFIAGVICALAAAVLSLFAAERNKAKITFAGTLVSGLMLVFPAARVLLYGGELRVSFEAGFPLGTVMLIIDPLSALFIILTVFGSLCSALYAGGYMRPYQGCGMSCSSHFFFFGLLYAAMIMVAVVQNVLAFLIVWEIMSLASFFLVLFENHKPEVRRAAINYLIMMHIGVTFLIAAFAAGISLTGSLNLDAFRDIADNTAATWIFMLCFVGFGIKAGFMPLHYWLPAAHPAAPSHVSGLMSGVMIKFGLYGILRMLVLFDHLSVWVGLTVLAVGLLSACAGIINAAGQRDIKRMLAYSSIENIGIIGIGLGGGMIGVACGSRYMAFCCFCGALLHIINHSLFKGLLFYGAGRIYRATHTRDMEKLGGLAAKMPYTAVLMLIGAAAICGLPPFNGFIGEFLIFIGLLSNIQAQNIPLAVAAAGAVALLSFAGALALLSFTRLYGIVFLGTPRSRAAVAATEAEPSMLYPMALMALLCLAGGVLPFLFLRLIEMPVAMLAGPGVTGAMVNTLHLLIPVVGIFALFIVFFLAVFLFRLMLSGRRQRIAATWGCGYTAPNERMQYTGQSFALPFLKQIKPFLKHDSKLEVPDTLFPERAFSQQDFKDLLEDKLFFPLVGMMRRGFAKFSWIQSGNIQHYLLYGLLFLFVAVLWVFFR